MERAKRRYVLFILIVLYTLNFVDRQIIGILAPPIKAELHLSDTKLGLMGGLAFALFYTFLAIPIGRAADRGNRTWIITLAVGVWSLFTAACGFVQNFTQLFLGRMGVGIGEAGGVAPAYSLIADYFLPGERARALAVYSFGIPLGSALGIFFGGYIAATVNWRMAFLVVGLLGLVLVPIFRASVREPERGLFDHAKRSSAMPSFGQTLRILFGKPSFWLLAFGSASSSILGYGLLFWLPSFFVRSFGLSLLHTSAVYGAIVLIGGMAGTWLGGWAADRLGAVNRNAYVLVPAVAFMLAAPCYALGVLMPPTTAVFLFFLIPQALGLAWLGPVLCAVQHVVAPNLRATASAIFLFVNNLIGIGCGTIFFGAVSDALHKIYGDDSLRPAILIGLGFYLLAALLFAIASRYLARDWYSQAGREVY
ncbi:MAG: MFS transporter [Alphaproteobacteria bacterium]|nr:MFS transporter [Alphaproteobacteria bacterium]